MHQRTCRVGVAGCGIAGSAVAFMLAEQGHEVVLFEQAAECGPVGAGILLQPSGQVVLQRFDLLTEVARQSARVTALHAERSRGKTLVRLPYAELPGDSYALGVHRGVLFGVLHQRCLAAGVTILTQHRIVDRSVSNGAVFLEDSEHRQHGPFDYVVAADGSRSALRAASGLRHWVKPYRHAALWFVGTNRSITDKLYQVVDRTHVLIGLLPTGNDQCSLFWGLREDDWPRLKESGLAGWKARLIDYCPAAEETVAEIESFANMTFATYRQVLMPRWFDDHTVFLGDAVHAMSPHLGQGVNLALLDAMTFAEAIADEQSFTTACQRYVHQRRRVVQYYWRLTRFLTPFFQSDGFILGLGRDLFLPQMPKVPWVRQQMLRTMAGLKQGWIG